MVRFVHYFNNRVLFCHVNFPLLKTILNEMQLFDSLSGDTDKNEEKQNISTILLFTTYIKASIVSIENTWNCFKTDLGVWNIEYRAKNFRI